MIQTPPAGPNLISGCGPGPQTPLLYRRTTSSASFATKEGVVASVASCPGAFHILPAATGEDKASAQLGLRERSFTGKGKFSASWSVNLCRSIPIMMDGQWSL